MRSRACQHIVTEAHGALGPYGNGVATLEDVPLCAHPLKQRTLAKEATCVQHREVLLLIEAVLDGHLD